MHGNVWEWTADWYGTYPTGPVTDPTGPQQGTERVFRGGSWYRSDRYCRSAYRRSQPPETRNFTLGFRLMIVAGSAMCANSTTDIMEGGNGVTHESSTVRGFRPRP